MGVGRGKFFGKLAPLMRIARAVQLQKCAAFASVGNLVDDREPRRTGGFPENDGVQSLAESAYG